MKQIALINSEFVALVDDEDFEWLSAFRWRAIEGRNGDFYAARTAIYPGGSRPSGRQMQRDILDPDMTAPRNRLSDHRNHNTLDNQRSNLRWLSYSESNRCRRLFKSNTSGYRGVSYVKAGTKLRRWRMAIRATGALFVSHHFTPEEAARAYNDLALKHYGEHAQLNVIPGDAP